MQIKDKIVEMVKSVHASAVSKKEIAERFQKEYPLIRKSAIDNFVSEGFTKERRACDSKVRLYAKVESIEKYGADEELIQSLPMIQEERLDNERTEKMDN